MTEDLDKAKKLFLDHGTSGFHMMREGVLKEYESFKVSREQEDIWRYQFIEDKLSKFDINDRNQPFSFRSIIQTHSDINSFEKYIDKVNRNIDGCKNQHLAILFGQELFSTLHELIRANNKIPQEVKLFCIDTCERLLSLAKRTTLPEGYTISNFSTISEGLTQEQYIQRLILKFEYEIELAKTLK